MSASNIEIDRVSFFYWTRISLLCGLILGIPILYAGTTDMHRARVSIAAAVFVLISVLGADKWKNSKRPEELWIHWGTLALISSLAIAALFAERELIAWIRVVEICLVLCVAAFVRRIVSENTSATIYILLAIVLSYTYSNYRLLLEWWTINSPESRNWAFSIPGYYYYRGLGFASFPALLVLAWLPLSGLSARFRYLNHPLGWSLIWGLSFLGWAVMAWSGTRAGFLSSAVGLFVLVWFKRKELNWIKMGLFWGTSSVLGSIASIPFTPNEGSFGFLRILGRSTSTGSVNEFSSGRLEIWIDAIKRMDGNWLLGLGPDQYQSQPALLSRILEPHNLIVNALSEGGLFCVLGLVLIGVGCIICSRRSSESQYQSILIALLAGYLIYSMLDGTLNWTLPLYTISILLGCLLGLPENTTRRVKGRAESSKLLRYFSLGIGVVSMGLSTLVFVQGRALLQPAPTRESAMARYLYTLPATTWGINAWLTEWEEKEASGLDKWYVLLIQKSQAPFFYRIQYGYYLVRRERPLEALVQFESALTEAPRASLSALEKAHGPLIAALRSHQSSK